MRTIVGAMLAIILVLGCSKPNPQPTNPTIPSVSTSAITNITQTTGSSGGSVTQDGGAAITARGICWSASQNPTIVDTKTTETGTTGGFTSVLSGLIPKTTYYVRAYATNSVGTAYGNQESFTTESQALAVLTTTSATSITGSTAVSGGSITSDAGSTITARGICWSTSQNPTVADSKTSDGNGTGNFSSSITGLFENTIYYVRAYATNSIGTAYGNQITFTTTALIPIVLNSPVTPKTGTTATCSAVISGGQAISQCGVCWSTSPNPTMANNKGISGRTMSSGYLTADFTAPMQRLKGNTTYYVRAFATSSLGTSYSNQVTYTPLQGSGTVTDADGNEYATEAIGTQVWMAENLRTTKFNDGTPIAYLPTLSAFAQNRTGAYCWYDNDEASNKVTYGALYNWYAVGTNKLCPVGWHVPTDSEWIVLTDFLGGASVAGPKLLEIGKQNWDFDFGTNSSGFTAVPNGYRSNLVNYGNLHGNAAIWTATEDTGNPLIAWYRTLYIGNDVQRNKYTKEAGSAVRCLKN